MAAVTENVALGNGNRDALDQSTITAVGQRCIAGRGHVDQADIPELAIETCLLRTTAKLDHRCFDPMRRRPNRPEDIRVGRPHGPDARRPSVTACVQQRLCSQGHYADRRDDMRIK